ncbi:hypothetical protein ACYIU4_002831 [Clostridium botulinum]
MAKKNEEMIKVKAIVCLKYNRKYIEIGQEFEVNKDDVKEMLDRGLIKLLEKLSQNTQKEVNDTQVGE